MLKSLRKELNKIIGKEEKVTMDQTVPQVPVAAVEDVQVDVQAEQLATLTASNTELSAQLATALASLEEVQSQLASVVSEKTALLAQAEDAKNKSRLSAITEAIGEAKAPALFAATKNLADADFQAVVSSLAGSVQVEAKTPLFTEAGANAEVDETQVVTAEADLVKKKLEAKYGTAK